MYTIIQLHEELLQLLLAKREEQANLRFWLRTRDSVQSKVPRLKKGYWFIGDDNYLFFAPYKKGDWKNKTKTIGLVLKETDGDFSKSFLEFVFPAEEKESRIQMYYSMNDTIKEKLNLVSHNINDSRSRMAFSFPESCNSMAKIVNFFLDKIYPILNEKIIEFKEEDTFFITKNNFDKQLKKTLQHRDKLHKLITVVYPVNFSTSGRLRTNFREYFGIHESVNQVEIIYNEKSYKNLLLNPSDGHVIFESQKNTFIEHHPTLIEGQAIQLKIIYDEPIESEIIENEVIEEEEEIIIPVKNFPLNQILYGPPGTGKTYNTVRLAADIISPTFVFDEENEEESYQEARNIYLKALDDQIEFVTFHQNFSYEDFIQGIRPNIENDDSPLSFKKVDGIFKNIADRALQNLLDSEKPETVINEEISFDIALEKYINEIEPVIIDKSNFPINETAYIVEIENNAFRYTAKSWKNEFRMKFSDLKTFHLHKVQSRQDVKQLQNISGLANQHATYYFKIYEQIKKHLPKEITAAKKVTKKSYVIIIDEINRANISRVFGELITLIEPDKRSHGKFPMTITLPSGDKFQVPSNLYILGTMNTADKSIALLDIALRRRFQFIPKYPDPELAIIGDDIMRKLNEIITKEKHRDFQIGHAYFMKENESLENVMNLEIIPLLMEYFMNNEEEVIDILTQTGLTLKKQDFPIEVTIL